MRAGLVGTLALFLRPTAVLLVLPLPFAAVVRGKGPVVRTVLSLGGGLLVFGATKLGFLLGEARCAEWWVPRACGLAGFLVLGAYSYAVAHPDYMIYIRPVHPDR